MRIAHRLAQKQKPEGWFEDPTNGMPKIQPRLNEDPRAGDWEGDRRQKMRNEAIERGLNQLPGWVTKWIIDADALTQGEDRMSIADAMNQTTPEEYPSISEATYEYYEAAVRDILTKHYNAFRKFHGTERQAQHQSVGKMVEDILKKYPPKQTMWSYDPATNKFSIEASTLSANGRVDPWGRPLPAGAEAFRDRDRDITHWEAVTTVAGVHIELTIFND